MDYKLMKCNCGKIIRNVPEHLIDCAEWTCYKCATRNKNVNVENEGNESHDKTSTEDY